MNRTLARKPEQESCAIARTPRDDASVFRHSPQLWRVSISTTIFTIVQRRQFPPGLGVGPDPTTFEPRRIHLSHYILDPTNNLSFSRNPLMCFCLKHFPAHHNDGTSLTSAVISEFKVHKMRQQPGLRPRPRWGSLQRSPRSLAGEKGIGKGTKGKGTEWRGGREGVGGEGRWREEEGKGKGDPTQVSTETDAALQV